jgi:hypothetical protein
MVEIPLKHSEVRISEGAFLTLLGRFRDMQKYFILDIRLLRCVGASADHRPQAAKVPSGVPAGIVELMALR